MPRSQLPHRGAQSLLLKDLLVQCRDRGAWRVDRLAQRRIEAVESLRSGILPQIIDIQARGEKILQ